MTVILDITEKQLQAQVVQLARTLGYRVYHTYDSRRSAHGFPDLCLLRERVIYVELKTARGKLSPAQKDWLRALHTAGCEAYVVRPRHLTQLALVLSNRMRYGDFPSGPAGENARIARWQLHDATREETADS